MKRIRVLAAALLVLLSLSFPALADTRALLVACSDFVSQMDLGAAISGNLHMIGSAFLSAGVGLGSLSIEDGTIGTQEALSAALHDAFDEAVEGDLSILYLCTHGILSSADDEQVYLLLGNGSSESPLGAQQLYALIRDIQGEKLLILDACFSGALIGRGSPSAGMLPGALLFNSQGQLAGLTMASYGEGLNRYVAYPADVLQARLSGEGPAEATVAEGQVRWLSGMEVTAERGELTVRWDHLQEPEGGAVYLIWQDAGNDYVSYGTVDWAEGYAIIACVPGRSYGVWMAASDGDAPTGDMLRWDRAVMVRAEETQPFTDYGFHDEIMYLTSVPEDQEYGDTEQIPPLGDFTVAGLAAEGLCCYLQAVDAYEVTETQTATLIIALQAPDGSVYTELAGYIFMPDLNGNDTWHADITELVRECIGYCGSLPGEYTLSYYLDGQLAASFTFTLE